MEWTPMSNVDLTIQTFINNSLINNGILRTDHFIITIPKIYEDLNAIKVNIPGIKLNVADIKINTLPKYYTQQVSRDSTVDITFIDDANFTIKTIFFNLMNNTNFKQSTQIRDYYDNFNLGTLNVVPVTPSGNTGNYMDTFSDVFVSEIKQMTFDKSDSKLVYTEVSFKYNFHEITLS